MNKIKDNWKLTFLTICTGQAFSLLSSAIVQFAIIWWITDKTGSALVLTISTLVGFLPQALCGPFVGTLIDRWNRKMIMVIADLAIAMTSLGLAMMFVFGEVQLWHIYIVLALRSLGTAFHLPAMLASVPLIVPSDQLTRAAGFNQAIQAASNIAGPALGAFVLAVWPMSGVIMMDVAGALLASVSLLLVQIPQPTPTTTDTQGQGFFKEMQFGWQALSKSRGLLILILATAMMTLVWMPINALFPLIVSRHFGGGAWHVGVSEIAFGSGMLLGSLILGLWGGMKNKVNTICAAYLVMGVTLFLMGSLPPSGFVGFAGAAALLGMSASMFGGPFTAIMQTCIEPGVQGRVFSFVNSIMLIATPAGLLVGGPLADRLGVAHWFLISGILIFLIGLTCWAILTVRRMEETM